ncbi:endonuclease/exonuclease/phosphatase family protein [Streptomyces thermospinosisporus]|uniref:Endonuclease/exonuclease/phosphatase family protein n=1 Tax=Streptomyces thermospinosisporus TaxID=161482 RepID=A0ABN1YYA9_9ACTN
MSGSKAPESCGRAPVSGSEARVSGREVRVSGREVRLLTLVLIAVCALLVGPSAPSGAGSPPPEPARDIVPNRVMTWNICNPCEESNVHRAAEIARFAPQVIGLQEACVRDVEQIREHLRSLHGLVYHVEYGPVLRDWSRCGGAPWRPGAYGQALLSAAPMRDVVNTEYPDGGSEDRGYLAVTTTVDGRSVRVINTHLAQRRQQPVRAGQIRVLAAVVSRHDRAIVLGDFNSVPDAPELTPLWDLAEDANPACHPSGTDTGTGTCETTTDWLTRFDYVFLRGGITALGHGVHQTRYSDHDLVHADLDTA